MGRKNKTRKSQYGASLRITGGESVHITKSQEVPPPQEVATPPPKPAPPALRPKPTPPKTTSVAPVSDEDILEHLYRSFGA